MNMEQQMIELTDSRTLDFYYQEAIKKLRTNIQFVGNDVKAILVTSCYANEGKSDVAVQLATEIANMQKKVLLIDADIRKSSLVSRYRVKKKVKGLSHYLCGHATLENVIHPTNMGFDIIFAGQVAPNPSELLESNTFHLTIQALKSRYDYILIDTPPVSSVADAAIVGKVADGCILVMESGKVKYRVAQNVKNEMEQSGVHILGVVLNKVDTTNDRYYGKYGKYGGYYANDYYSKGETKNKK
jgi:capsular exopolysaccharide synthesis family protein